MIRSILIVAVGGALGSALRYAASLLVAKYYVQKFPLSTFLVNIAGCFLIGLFAGYLTKNSDSTDLRLFLITGLCGGFTTFSAFGIENLSLIKNGDTYLSLLYILLSVVIGVAFVAIGLFAAGRLNIA